MCQSLHRVALQCQQDVEGCWYYHQTVVPCLLAMAVQAAMQGRCGAGAGEGKTGGSPGSGHCWEAAGQGLCLPPPRAGGSSMALSSRCLQRAPTRC